jgi:ribosomal protein S18 acetylase RimI-like enzyme
MRIVIRKAVESDTEFVIDSIINAEKSGTEKITYCEIFSISEEDFRNILHQILEEEIEGFEFCIKNFLVAQINQKMVGAVSGWIEGTDGMSSSLLKMNAFSFFLSKTKINSSHQNIKIIEEIGIEREIGCLQLDSVYTLPEYRRQGITGILIEAHINQVKKQNPEVKKSQIILMKENLSAMEAYQKAGFTKVLEKYSENRKISEILPGRGKLLLERQL